MKYNFDLSDTSNENLMAIAIEFFEKIYRFVRKENIRISFKDNDYSILYWSNSLSIPDSIINLSDIILADKIKMPKEQIRLFFAINAEIRSHNIKSNQDHDLNNENALPLINELIFPYYRYLIEYKPDLKVSDIV